jgi:hypothetical protein
LPRFCQKLISIWAGRRSRLLAQGIKKYENFVLQASSAMQEINDLAKAIKFFEAGGAFVLSNNFNSALIELNKAIELHNPFWEGLIG